MTIYLIKWIKLQEVYCVVQRKNTEDRRLEVK